MPNERAPYKVAGWRIRWRSNFTGFEGHGQVIYTRREAITIAAESNQKYPGLYHWAEAEIVRAIETTRSTS